ncbi:MAG: hypothetical protein RLZZ367_2389 [Bacteroidota bacterium]
MRVGALWCVLYYYYTLKPQPMRKPIAALLAVMVLLVSQCTKPKETNTGPDPNQVSITYYYLYNGDTDSTYIEYSAAVGQSSYYVSGIYDSISFNGKKVNVLGGFAVLTFKGFVDSGTFVYSDVLGHTYTQTITGLQKYTLPAGFTGVNRHTNDTIYWDGPAYNGTQNIKLTLKQGQQVNESFFNNSAPYITVDSTWMLQHLQPAFNSLTTQLEYIGGGGVGSGAPLGSSVDIRIQSPVKVVSVY